MCNLSCSSVPSVAPEDPLLFSRSPAVVATIRSAPSLFGYRVPTLQGTCKSPIPQKEFPLEAVFTWQMCEYEPFVLTVVEVALCVEKTSVLIVAKIS